MKKQVKICENLYEHQYWNEGKLVVGIDEAGRGPLAGPLSVAGVIFPAGYENPAIYDSKALSERKEMLYLKSLRKMLCGLKLLKYQWKILIIIIF